MPPRGVNAGVPYTATPVEIAGTSVGTVNLFPFLGGAIFMPFLGKVLDLYEKNSIGAYSIEAYSMLFKILLIASVISLFCTFLIKETHFRIKGGKQ